MNKTEANMISDQYSQWDFIKKQMSQAYTQLVHTNSIVIKNNYILSIKVVVSKKKLSHLQEIIETQQCVVDNLAYSPTIFEEQMKVLTDTVAPKYCELVDATVMSNDITMATKLFKYPSVNAQVDSIANIAYNKLCTDTQVKIDSIKEVSYKYMQDKVDTLTASCHHLITSPSWFRPLPHILYTFQSVSIPT